MNYDEATNYDYNEQTMTNPNGIDVSRLTSKKKQYLIDQIQDKNGVYSYL